MKKFLSFLLIAVMVFGAAGTIGLSVFAEGDTIEATQWEPTEIKLESTKQYKNPYLDVKIDAVFTHEDGTTITLPGFWYEKNTFAVRFSPTKTGKWTYTITSDDASNTSLNKQGTLNAKENTSDKLLGKHGFIRTEENNPYFVYDDGTPFFWLGDTHWQAPQCEQIDRCNYPGCLCYNQFKHEVDNRKSKGFTVYQTYFDTPETDGGSNAAAKLGSMWKEKFSLPSSEVFNNKIDYMFGYLHEQDIVLALGFGVHASTANSMTLSEMKPFVRYIVGRYACYSIVWITAQEITRDNVPAKDKGLSVMDFWIEVAREVAALDGYKHPASAHMDVISFADKESFKLSQETWHTFWATQGGHGKRLLSKKSRYQGYLSMKQPVIEAEYNYEDINCGEFTGYDLVRYGAWNSYLNGLAGYTYGATGIWANCFSNEGYTGWYGALSSYSYEPWYIGLDKPGSYDMMYLKNFFMTIPNWSKLVPRFYDTRYADFINKETMLLASTHDSSTFAAYFRNKDTSTGTINNLDAGKTYQALWFNVITGKFIEIAKDITGSTSYTLPQKPTAEDWAFLLTSEKLNNYSVEEPYEKPKASENIGNLITPYKVKAVGGIYSSNGREQDNTKYLYDLNGKSSWEPLADRTTQTIIYDLGAVYDVTQINLVPGVETTLPNYRIEGSTDGSQWTVIVNSRISGQTMSKDGTYFEEALSGAYRYIKVLLLNAEDIKEEDAKKIGSDYRLVYNAKVGPAYYTHTAIAEISVFGTGKTDIDTLINSNVPHNVPLNENESEISFNTAAVAITGGAAVLLIAAACIIKAVSKKKKQ